MIGKSIHHYRITRELGRGGMGVVYQAQDTRLERSVALKFLAHPWAAGSPERQRFEREARAAAALSHPNIAHVYSIEEDGGQPFIVMEYVDGRELRGVLADGTLAYEHMLDIAAQIASALKAAHDRGVVHRDIKSANIMLSGDGVVKVMDFGLARMSADTRLTRSGMVMGTVDYMSPEQVRGEDADHRTDIWSFGVLLYEMLCGERPYRGDYEQAVMYAILNEDAKPLSTPHVELAALIARMLARNRNERCQSMAEISEAIRKLKGSGENRSRAQNSHADKPPALAVLPFASIRNDPDMSFLGFALADQIIGALTYAGGVMVRPSSAVRKYQNQEIDAPTAGRELHVDYVLGGHYLKESDTIRLNVELVAAEKNEIVWRDAIELKYENTFKLQDIVSDKVLRGLNVKFARDERPRAPADEPNDPVAYEYYLRAVSYPISMEGNELAMKMLDVAVGRDPGYAPAHAERGFRLRQLAFDGMLGMKGFQPVEEALLTALRLNENLLPAVLDLTFLYIDVGRTREAVEWIHRMFQLAPGTALPHFSLGYLYRYVGMLDESVQQVEKALRLDPRNPRFRSAGFTYLYTGNYEKACEIFDLDRTGSVAIGFRGLSLLLMGQKERAVQHFDRVIAMEPQSFPGRRFAVIRAAALDQTEEAARLTRSLASATANESDSEHWYFVAEAFALTGDAASCARMLRKAADGGFFNHRAMVASPFLNLVRDDPAFRDTVEYARGKHEEFKEWFTREWAGLLSA